MSTPHANRLLAALPAEARQQIVRASESIALELRHPLIEPEHPITHVHFVTSGVASNVVVMSDGGIVEVGTIGNEGMVGLALLFGAETSPHETFQQVTGSALRMPAEAFRHSLATIPEFSKIMHRYAQAYFVQVSQSTACNRLHSAEERCARWLLMTADRAQGPEFDLTHEFLAQMLGVRRASVTVVAGALQQAGLIAYSRGSIRILDRPRLEEAACECYAITRQAFERLLPPAR